MSEQTEKTDTERIGELEETVTNLKTLVGILTPFVIVYIGESNAPSRMLIMVKIRELLGKLGLSWQ